jgi:hypothetical protein
MTNAIKALLQMTSVSLQPVLSLPIYSKFINIKTKLKIYILNYTIVS